MGEGIFRGDYKDILN